MADTTSSTGFGQFGYTPSPSGSGTYNNSSNTKDSSVLNDILGNAPGVLDGLSKIWSVSQGNPYGGTYAQQNGTYTTTPLGTNGSGMLWIILAVVAAIIIAFIMMRGGSK